MKELLSRRKVLVAMVSSFIGGLALLRLPDISISEAEITNVAYEHTINVGDYMLKGVSPDEAFRKANNAMKATIDKSTASEGRHTGRARLIIPAGRFVIKDPSVFLVSPESRTLGLIIEGQGRGVTEIIFKPTKSKQYLITNNDKWLFLEFRDMTFVCGEESFMLSTSNGGAQNYIFNRVNWSGCRYGLRLQGNNNNSEFTFNQCGITGKVDTFLWSETSDQFLNYHFFSCNFEVNGGNFCRFDKGGNINIWGGSFIHTSEAGGTFFKLMGTQHAEGVMRFLCEGVRFEHRKPKSKLIECEWSSGSVKFSSCDMSSQAYEYDHNQVTALFSSNNTAMPIIHFDDCMILGRHQYNYMVESYTHNQLISYNHCEIFSGDSPQQFIIIKNKDNTSNLGGAPVIHFSHCRGRDSTEIWDCVYNYQINNLAVITKKTLSVKNADGKFPYKLSAIVSVKLPINAIITRITLSVPEGATTLSDTNNFTLKNAEGRVLLEQVTGTVNRGFVNDINNLLIVCDTNARRTIHFIAGSNINHALGNGSLCLIEYLG